MIRLTILALTATAALLATHADAEAQGNGPQASQIVGKSIMYRLVVEQGEASILRQDVRDSSPAAVDAMDEDLPEIADFSQAPSELWHLRPAVQDALGR